MNKLIQEIIILNSGDLVIVEKLQEGDTTAYSRRTIKVGQDVASEHSRIQQIANWVHTESFLGTPLIPLNNTNWDNFNSQMLSDPEFNQVYNTVNAITPVVCASLPAALTQVSNGQLSMFAVVWSVIMVQGQANQTQRDKWGQWAEDANLPTEFVIIIKGL